MSAPNELELWTPLKCQGVGCTTWTTLPAGKGLLIQWLMCCRSPPSERSIQSKPASGHCYLTYTGGPKPKIRVMKTTHVISLSNNKSKQGDTGRSNQSHLVDLAFQPKGQQLASHYLFSTYMMSNYVIVLLAEDRCCTHICIPLYSSS